MNSPIWIPASYPPATRSTGSFDDVTSNSTSGNRRANSASFGNNTSRAAVPGTTSRIRPAGRSRNCRASASAPSIRSSAGPNSASNALPAAVGATLRVVRASNCSPILFSSPRMAWLSADCDTPNRPAARVKLLSSATTAKAARTPANTSEAINGARENMWRATNVCMVGK